MNVLVINGSPKGENSNSLRLTHAFLEGAGWDKIDIIDCSTKNIKPCLDAFHVGIKRRVNALFPMIWMIYSRN